MPFGGNKPIVDCNDPIIDVKKVIQDWAWQHYMRRAGPLKKKFMRRKKFVVEVPMNYYQFEDTKTTFEDITSEPSNKIQEMSSIESREPVLNSTNPNTSVLSTKYVNDTGKDQVYKFRMERTRKATVDVTFQKGFSIEGTAKFSLAVADGEINSRFEITKTEGQTFEQTLLFETSSDINVQEKTDCTAMVVFTENEMSKKFTVQTTMSMPSGSAPIFIRRKKDKKLFALLKLTNLKNAFQSQKDVEILPVEFTDVLGDTYNTSAVRFTTTGIIKGMRLSGQTVKLRAVQISEGVSTSIGTVDEELAKHSASNRL